MPLQKFEADCARCNARAGCVAGAVPAAHLGKAQTVVYVRRTLKRGEALFAAGDTCSAVYAVRRGFFKTVLVTRNGRAQVTGFFMGSDLLGMDAACQARHTDTAVALEDSEVCVMPCVLMEQVAREVPGLQHALHAALSREIAHSQRAMVLLASMHADERLATFFLDLSARLARRGLSGSRLRLRMTRADIGSYVGLSLETVSRLFTRFQRKGLIRVNQRLVEILDFDGLARILRRDAPAQETPSRLVVPMPAQPRRRRPAAAAIPNPQSGASFVRQDKDRAGRFN